MSYTTAKAQLVSIMKNVVATDNRVFGADRRFTHVPDGKSGVKCPSRSFWIEALLDGEGGVTGPFTPELPGQPRLTFPLTLTVSYQVYERKSVVDEVMAADLIAYSKALLTPSNWNRPSSGIHNITSAAPIYLPTRRVVVGEFTEQRSALSLWFN